MYIVNMSYWNDKCDFVYFWWEEKIVYTYEP